MDGSWKAKKYFASSLVKVVFFVFVIISILHPTVFFMLVMLSMHSRSALLPAVLEHGSNVGDPACTS